MKAVTSLVATFIVVYALTGCGEVVSKQTTEPARQEKTVSSGGQQRQGEIQASEEAEYIGKWIRNWRNNYAQRPFSQEELFRSLYLTKDEFFKEYGKGRFIRLDSEGIRQGYLYSDFGVCVSFGEDGRVLFIDVRDGFEINGAKAGMDLEKVKMVLGKTTVRTDHFSGDSKVYVLEYTLAECVAQFISADRGGADDGTSFLRVLPRRDIETGLKQTVKALTGEDVVKMKDQPGVKAARPENPVKGDWWNVEYSGSPLAKEDLVGLVSLTKGEILKRYGYDYAIVRTGAEGLRQGYFFRQLGVCILFDADGKVEYMECGKGAGIDGVTRGSSLDEVRAKLGDVPVKVVYWEGSVKTYALEYPIGNGIVQFFSYQMRPNNYVSRMMIKPKGSKDE